MDGAQTLRFNRLNVAVHADRAALGRAAARAVAARMQEVLRTRDVSVVFASAPSQNEFLAELSQAPGIAWDRVTAFHLDEYVGLAPTAPQAFAQFLRDRLWQRIRPRAFHALDGMAADAEAECRRYEALLRAAPLDIACVGIGENGHLAFNDPPADLSEPSWVKVVDLDLVSRQQQVADGCFKVLDDVPAHALTLTIPAIYAAHSIFCMVPGQRKAEAVRRTLYDSVSPNCPASVLRQHPAATLYLDTDSARLIQPVGASR
jgi:glucosamine-6-phosphate deaminase